MSSARAIVLLIALCLLLPSSFCACDSTRDATENDDGDDAKKSKKKSKKKKSKKKKSKKKKKKKKKTATSDLEDFLGEWESDIDKAKAKYFEKEVSLGGYVIGVKNMKVLGSFQVSPVKDDLSRPYLSCLVSAKDGQPLNVPDKGQLVTVEGKVIKFTPAKDDNPLVIVLQGGCTWKPLAP